MTLAYDPNIWSLHTILILAYGLYIRTGESIMAPVLMGDVLAALYDDDDNEEGGDNDNEEK